MLANLFYFYCNTITEQIGNHYYILFLTIPVNVTAIYIQIRVTVKKNKKNFMYRKFAESG